MLGKTCSKCSTHKNIDAFNNYHKALDGKQSWCKSCFRVRYLDNREEMIARQIEYNKTYDKRNLSRKKKKPCLLNIVENVEKPLNQSQTIEKSVRLRAFMNGMLITIMIIMAGIKMILTPSKDRKGE